MFAPNCIKLPSPMHNLPGTGTGNSVSFVLFSSSLYKSTWSNQSPPTPLYCAFLLSFASFSLSLSLSLFLSLFSASIALCLSTLALILRMYRRATLCGSPRKSQRAMTRSSGAQRTPPCCRCRTFLAAKEFLELPGTVHAPLF